MDRLRCRHRERAPLDCCAVVIVGVVAVVVASSLAAAMAAELKSAAVASALKSAAVASELQFAALAVAPVEFLGLSPSVLASWISWIH